MKNITVIGAGTMGNGIAHVFAQHGFEVALADISREALDKALATISRNLDRMVRKEKIKEGEKSETLGRIHAFTDIGAACRQSDLVVEAAPERLPLKEKIFAQIDSILSDRPMEKSVACACNGGADAGGDMAGTARGPRSRRSSRTCRISKELWNLPWPVRPSA